MKNILLWIATTIAYFLLLCAVGGSTVSGHLVLTLTVVALLCAPFNINGNIFTVLGNAESEKNNFSLVSIYQKAGKSAFALTNLFQEAGKNAWIITGLCISQKASQEANFGIGVITVQAAGTEARTCFALALIQTAEQGNAVELFGLTLLQCATKDAIILFGMAGVQIACKDAAVVLGMVIMQQANNNAGVDLGVAIVQIADNEAGVCLGVAAYQVADEHAQATFGFYQKVKNKARVFSVFSGLKAS